MLRPVASVVIALGSAHKALAQAPLISALISDISYQITADSPAVGRRQPGVVMSFRTVGTTPVILTSPR